MPCRWEVSPGSFGRGWSCCCRTVQASSLSQPGKDLCGRAWLMCDRLTHTVTHSHTLGHSHMRLGTLRHTQTHLGTLRHTHTHMGTLRHTWTHSGTLRHPQTHTGTLTHSGALRHSHTHSDTLSCILREIFSDIQPAFGLS